MNLKYSYRVVNDTYEDLDPIATIYTYDSYSELIYTLNGEPVFVKQIPRFQPAVKPNKIQPAYAFQLGDKFYISPMTTFYIECITQGDCSSATIKPAPTDIPYPSFKDFIFSYVFRKGESNLILNIKDYLYFKDFATKEQVKILYHILKGQFVSLAPYFEYTMEYITSKLVNVFTGLVNYKAGNIYTIYVTDKNLIVFGLRGFVKIPIKNISIKNIDDITPDMFHADIQDIPAVLAIGSMVSSIDIDGYENIIYIQYFVDNVIYTPYIRNYILTSNNNDLQKKVEDYKNFLKQKIGNDLNFEKITGIPIIDIDMTKFKLVLYGE